MAICVLPPEQSISGQTLKIAWNVENDAAGTKQLWFEISKDFHDLVDDGSDAAVVGLLAPAIIGGHDVHVAGPMSEKLYYQLSYQAIPILSEMFSARRPIKLSAAKIVRPQPAAAGVLTGFSAGIDSFCTLHDHSDGQVPDSFRITHLAYNNVGAHGRREAGQSVFFQGAARTLEFAKETKYPLITVNSNLDDFYDGKFQGSHTLRNAAVALLLQRGFRRFLYSSAYPFRETKAGPNYNIAYLDPILVPLLGTERLDCVLSGARWSRVEKTRRITTLNLSHRYLDVCTRPHLAPKGMPNCGICWKCVRTELTLEAMGHLEAYGSVFPLTEYRRFRKLYLMEVMASKDPMVREIRDLLSSANFNVGWRIRSIAYLLPSPIASRISRSFPYIRHYRRLLKLLSAAL